MKKHLFLLSAFALLLFSSCSSDDDNGGGEEPAISGTWELTAIKPNNIPGWNLSACQNNPKITFTADGTAIWTLYDAQNECAESQDSGNWEKNEGNNYTVTIPDLDEVEGTVEFDGANKFNFTTSSLPLTVVLTFEK